jgi:SAM-dependent methyltransferase
MPLWLARTLVFGTSAIVLVVEILAGRLMAPYVGISLETFTGVIGVILAGIALGAWAGGVSADRGDPTRLLGPLLVGGGIATLVAPPIADVVGRSLGGSGPVEIVLLTTAAFALPAILLSAVPPIVVKVRLASLGETGTVVGSFSAIGTVGALVGTFATGFVLIATVPSRPLMALVGSISVVAGLVFLVGARRFAAAVVGGVAALAAGVGLAAAAGPCDVESPYHCVSVRVDPERPSGRSLWLDTLRHSYIDLDDPTHLEFRYTKVIADLQSTLPPGPLAALYVGGGCFTLPVHLHETRPGSTAHVLEIDPVLVDIATDDFGVEFGGDLTVAVGDARLALPDLPDDAYDIVVGDAFGGLSVPWHLTTHEFLGEIDRVLAPGGIYVMNVIDYPPLRFAAAQAATAASVFDDAAVVAPPDYLAGDRGGNIVVVGSDGPLDRVGITAVLEAAGRGERITDDAAFDAYVDGARVLRDDFAPVDQLLSR